ncbi:MAG: glycerophosphodiester phosphodiesterase [Thermotogota bacterium]|nr:glycerophosphodiester phosphodiesterase [Thermotogota bacterium]
MKKVFIIAIIVFLLISISFSERILPYFDLQGHRGCRGLRPENTLEAFEHALEIGVTTLELDTGITKDSVPVVSHDRALNPQKTRINGTFITEEILIKDITYEELSQYDVGVMRSDYDWPRQKEIPCAKIPRLEDVFVLVKEYEELQDRKIMLNIETKISPSAPEKTFSPEEFVEILLELIEEYEMEDRVIIQSFYWKTIMLVKEKNSSIKTAALLTSSRMFSTKWLNGLRFASFGFDVGNLVKASGADFFSPSYSDCSDKWVESAHDQCIPVIPWTINDKETMKDFIEKGVDGIITDYPDILKDLLDELNIEYNIE